MFMDQSAFDDDDNGRQVRKEYRKPRRDRDESSNIDTSGDFGSAGSLIGSSSSRSKVLQQQRELQLKKKQDRMNGGGLSNPLLVSSTKLLSGAIRSSGIKNFSSPRDHDIDDQPSRFGREDNDYSFSRASRIKKESNGRSRRFNDDDDDDEGYGRRRRGYDDDDDDEDDYPRRKAPSKVKKNRNEQRNGRDKERKESTPVKARKNIRNKSPDVSSEEEIDDLDHDSDTQSVTSSHSENSEEVDKPATLALDLSDIRSFLTAPVSSQSGVVECYIERNKSGSNKLFPEYCLYLKNGDRFLLTAKKRPNNKTSNYLISMKRGDLSRTSSNYLGKLRANFVGTEFVVYDNGDSAKDSMKTGEKVRHELACVLYASNVLGSRGPRKMRVCVPRVRDDGTRVTFRPRNKDDEMMAKCKEEDHTNLTYLINKPPRWNEQVGAYVLNFNGRVTMASVKNFQLVTPEDQENVVLQFGRVGKDLFTMDFRAPLCPLQAFAVTLSSFDSKLACE